MNNKEYLNEEKYQKVKKVLITIGCISFIIGVGLFIGSFFVKVPAMGQDGWFVAENLQSILRFVAFPFGLMIPVMTFSIAFRREMTAFSTQQVMPVAQEGIDKMSPTIGKAAKEVTKGVIEGLEEENNEEE